MSGLVFHEKQEGQLCGQHCLNTLLQGAYYSPVELATLAQELDSRERALGGASAESSNVDNTGFFSLQVLQLALETWGLSLVSLASSSELALLAHQNASIATKAYIINFQLHWYTLRKLGPYWFNLNSMLSGPQLISETYLDLLLRQLHDEGCGVFIVAGDVAETSADEYFQHNEPEVAAYKHVPATEAQDEEIHAALGISRIEAEERDESLQRVLAASRAEEEAAALTAALKASLDQQGNMPLISDTGASMNRAIAASSRATAPVPLPSSGGQQLSNTSTAATTTAAASSAQPSLEDVRARRLAALEKRTSGAQ